MLRHYDSGNCRGKLGHSRASVLWHRAQVYLQHGFRANCFRIGLFGLFGSFWIVWIILDCLNYFELFGPFWNV